MKPISTQHSYEVTSCPHEAFGPSGVQSDEIVSLVNADGNNSVPLLDPIVKTSIRAGVISGVACAAAVTLAREGIGASLLRSSSAGALAGAGIGLVGGVLLSGSFRAGVRHGYVSGLLGSQKAAKGEEASQPYVKRLQREESRVSEVGR